MNQSGPSPPFLPLIRKQSLWRISSPRILLLDLVSLERSLDVRNVTGCNIWLPELFRAHSNQSTKLSTSGMGSGPSTCDVMIVSQELHQIVPFDVSKELHQTVPFDVSKELHQIVPFDESQELHQIVPFDVS